MNKIVPFNKDIVFKTTLFEICSISLEKEVKVYENNIKGEFILEGEYKSSNTTTLKENYNFRVPFDIKLDEKYDLTNVVVDINDFYYEIKDNNTLSIYIELKLDNLEEKEIKVENVETDRCIEEEPTVMNNTGYLTYKIYIVKENDTIESIISKYSVSKELLDSYNDLSDIKLGDKIIIPTNVKSS